MHNKCFTIHSLWDHLHRLSSHDTVFSTCAQLTSSTSISSLLLTLPKERKQRIVQASNKSAFTPFSSTPYELHISFRSSKRKNLSSQFQFQVTAVSCNSLHPSSPLQAGNSNNNNGEQPQKSVLKSFQLIYHFSDKRLSEYPEREEERICPAVTKAETNHSLNLSTVFRYMLLESHMFSSTRSRAAWAMNWLRWR